MANPEVIANGQRAYWSSRLLFILAATGSAVGLGNIWKFPYITGENGGGAFVLVYLACIAIIGVPILVAELMLGRRGGNNPVSSMRRLAAEAGRPAAWRFVGWMGVLAAVIILSFYSVVGGWTLAYIAHAAGGDFTAAVATGDAAAAIGALFERLLADPLRLLGWHSLFMLATVVIVARGVRRGLEWATRILMPGLFVLLLVLVAYAAFTTGAFGRALGFMFRPDFSALSWEAVLVALGHAFFSLSLGLGVMLAYGSYVPRQISLGRAAVAIAVLDTAAALLAGLAIFPLVFAHGLEPGAGPGLVFATLPLVFGQVAGGALFGTLFFVFVFIAALTSAISLLEPMVEYLSGRRGVRRPVAAAASGAAIWLLGLGPLLALNVAAGFKPFGLNLFDLFDFVTSRVMLPLGGLLIAIFAGWMMSRASVLEALGVADDRVFRLWRFVLRYLSPVAVALMLVSGLF